MKDHVEISLKERSTSFKVCGNLGIGVPISDILLDFKTRRCKFGSFVMGSSADSEGKRFSSSVKSVMVGFKTCDVRLE